MDDPRYLGDGVYANDDGYHIMLMTPEPRAQVIYLDPDVLDALEQYIQERRKARATDAG